MSEVDEGPKTITVSRDALRADLAEFELRLRDWIAEQLISKASAAVVTTIVERQDALDRGEFTPGFALAIREVVVKSIQSGAQGAWSLRANKIQAVLAGAALCSLVLSAFLVIHTYTS